MSTLSRNRASAQTRTFASPFTVTIRKWPSLTLISLAALIFTACGAGPSVPAAQPATVVQGDTGTPTAAPASEASILSLTSLDFSSVPSTVSSGAPTVVYQTADLTVTRTARTVGETGGLRSVHTTYEVLNTGRTTLHNLTFIAVHRAASNVAGTAVSAMQTASGQPLSLPEAARGLTPELQVPDASSNGEATDAQAFTANEASAFTARAQAAGLLSTDDDALGYGFVVHQANGARSLAPGERGQVQAGFVLPDVPADADSAQADQRPASFSVSFLLTQDPVTRVTQLGGESLDSAVTRAGGPVNADQVVALAASQPSAASQSAASQASAVQATGTAGLKVVPLQRVQTFTVPRGQLYGVIQSQTSRLRSDYQAGLRVRTLELAWDRAEPGDGQWNESYLSSKRSEYLSDVQAGFEVVLDLGVQYPPAWLQQLPDSQFVDQHGTVYRSQEPGANPVNAVFNRSVRSAQARYVTRMFQELGPVFYGVRLGWGRYGELGFPLVDPAANSYWAFDALAQGQRAGLPDGVQPDPIPDWKPLTGTQAVSAGDQAAARKFAEWYLGSLNNYHDWQIQLVRSLYPGRLFMLYPSFGLRPGQLDQAVAGGLSGRTSPEVNTELQRGFDFARYVAGIRDPLAMPYTTWLDADGFFVDDTSQNTAGWSPAHYLSVLAAANPVTPQVWGENTGRNTLADLNRCVNRVKTYHLGGMFWAFNADLYDSVHASISEYHSLIANP